MKYSIDICRDAEVKALRKFPGDRAERLSYENQLLRQQIDSLCIEFNALSAPKGTLPVTYQGFPLDVTYTFIPEIKSTPANPPMAAFVSVHQVYLRGMNINALLSDRQNSEIAEEIMRRINK